MSGKQIYLSMILVVVAGFLGGMVSERLFGGAAKARSVTAQEYQLVDASGMKRATFVVNIMDQPSLILRDNQGHPQATLSFDAQGQPVWSMAVPQAKN